MESSRPSRRASWRDWGRIALCAWLCLASVAPSSGVAGPSDPHAQLKEQMRERFNRGDYRGTIEAATSLYRQTRDPQLLANIGRCHELLGELRSALRYYDRFLARVTVPRLRRPVETQRRLIRQRLATTSREVRIESRPSRAVVEIDQRRNPKWVTPFVVWIPFGARTVRFRKPGFRDATRSLRLDAGPLLVLDVEMVRREPAGRLTIYVASGEALVRLDGKLVGSTPLVDFRVAPGPHVLRVERTGYLPHTRTLRIEDRKELLLRIELTPLPATRPKVVAPAPRPQRRRSYRVAAYTMLGIGLGLLGGGLGFQLGARSTERSANDFAREKRDAQQLTPEAIREYTSRYNRARTYQKVAIAFYSVGGAALVTSLVLFLVEPKRSETIGRWRLRPLLEPGRTLGLCGDFLF